jgi:hypothetical protein
MIQQWGTFISSALEFFGAILLLIGAIQFVANPNAGPAGLLERFSDPPGAIPHRGRSTRQRAFPHKECAMETLGVVVTVPGQPALWCVFSARWLQTPSSPSDSPAGLLGEVHPTNPHILLFGDFSK